MPFSSAWDRLSVQLTDPSTRYRLTPLMRFCSGMHIEPKAVDEAVIDCYMEFRERTTTRASETHCPVLCRGIDHTALWVSSTTGKRMMRKSLATLVSKITRETLGVDVSPHLFRTAGASTAALYGGNLLHLASALLGHRDKRVTEENYNFATCLSASEEYALIAKSYR